MNCNIIKDLIPLYIDNCCSTESSDMVKEHIKTCDSCKKLYEEMKAPSESISTPEAPKKMYKINNRRASVLQSVLLYGLFALIILGVSLEASTPTGNTNGYWALSIIIPATAFMLSLANWYFLRNYRSRKAFSIGSMLSTLAFTLGGYLWGLIHYNLSSAAEFDFGSFIGFYGVGILLSSVFIILSKVLSDKFAKMLGKE